MIVMLRVTFTEPPLLFAQTVYVIALVCNMVGIPQIVPLLEPMFKPEGRLGLISQVTISPAPVKVGVSGKMLLVSFFVRVRFSGEYDNPGTLSIIVR